MFPYIKFLTVIVNTGTLQQPYLKYNLLNLFSLQTNVIRCSREQLKDFVFTDNIKKTLLEKCFFRHTEESKKAQAKRCI